jgi:hypothetical protein
MTATSPNRPTHKLYRVVKGLDGAKDIWTEIAACWPHSKGGGFTIKFKPNESAVPGGQYVMRPDTRPAKAQP